MGEESEVDEDALDGPQCPATWGLPSSNAPPGVTAERLRDLLHVSDGAWTTLALRLLLSYELGRAGESASSLEELNQCREVLRRAVGSNDLVTRARPALRHVLRAAHSAHQDHQDHDEQGELAAGLAQLDRRQRAAIWGLRATALRFYGCEGWQSAGECAERAVGLDLDETAWQHLLGLYRRDRALLQAVLGAAPGAASTKPVAALHLAASLLLEAARVTRGDDVLGDLLDATKAIAQAADLAGEAAQARADSAYVQAHAALLLRLAAALWRRGVPGGPTENETTSPAGIRTRVRSQVADSEAASWQSWSKRSAACARRVLALAPRCLLAQTVVAATWGSKGRGALQASQRDRLHHLYGMEAHRAVELLQDYSFGLLYLMARPE